MGKQKVAIMPAFKRPHLKVDQAKSAFAEGNQRWYDREIRFLVERQWDRRA